MKGNRKILALLCVFIIDILCWYFDKGLFLFPLGIMYIILLEIILVDGLFWANTKYFVSQQSWLPVKIIAVLLIGIHVYELINLDRSCGGCKAKMWNLSYPYLSGAFIAIGLVLISHKFNKNKSVIFLLVLLSVFWLVAEPIVMLQLEFSAVERINVYRYPVISPVSDLFYYILMFIGLLAPLFMPIILLVGGGVMLYRKSLFLERLSILLSMLLFVFYSANWGGLYFDI